VKVVDVSKEHYYACTTVSMQRMVDPNPMSGAICFKLGTSVPTPAEQHHDDKEL